MSEKIYVGNGKVRTSDYGEFYTLSLKTNELEKYTNEKWYVSIVVNKRKEEDKFWNDLAVTINDYKPKAKENTKEELRVEEIPFR